MAGPSSWDVLCPSRSTFVKTCRCSSNGMSLPSVFMALWVWCNNKYQLLQDLYSYSKQISDSKKLGSYLSGILPFPFRVASLVKLQGSNSTWFRNLSSDFQFRLSSLMLLLMTLTMRLFAKLCMFQALCQYPTEFEFNSFFLQTIAYHHISNRFSTFLGNSDWDRVRYQVNRVTFNFSCPIVL